MNELYVNRKLAIEISQKSSLVNLQVKFCSFEEKQLLTLDHLLNLEKLVLDSTSIYNINQIFKTLENTCGRTIQRLDLRHNSHIDAPNGIIKFQNLTYLNIGSSVNVSDDFIKGFTNNCQKIKHLNIASWKGMSILALRSLSNFKNLEYLNAANVSELDSGVIYNIANNCKNLKYLNITFCHKISRLAVKEIVKNCPKLELLDIVDANTSLQTIVSSAKIVRHRKNNIVLTLRVKLGLIERFNKLKNTSFKSPWFKLEHDEDDYCGNDSDVDFGDGFDSDDSTDLDNDYFDSNDVDFDSDSTIGF